MKKKNAVIIGGSIAGLVIGRVLADHFEQVTIIERDGLDGNQEHRPGVPQSRHLHALLMRGLEALQQLFPGLKGHFDETRLETIVPGSDFPILYPSGWSPRVHTPVMMRPCTRPFLERAIRDSIQEFSNIRILKRSSVTGLIPGADNRSIDGVVLGDRTDNRIKILRGDLIIDASGRNSQSGKWLETLGYQVPEETIIDAHWGYAARFFDRPKNFDQWKGILILNKPPDHPRLGILMPMEGDRWLVNLAGVMNDHPPGEDQGFLEFAKSLRSEAIYDAIKNIRPASPIYLFRHTANVRRRYENFSRWPEKFLVMGDALCAFNPVYGQGMTVCALEALALQDALPSRNYTAGFSKRLQKQFSKIVDTPWTFATSEDLRWPATTGGTINRATRFMHSYIDRVLNTIPYDSHTFRVFSEVQHMKRSPRSLFSPRILWNVWRKGSAKEPLQMHYRTSHQRKERNLAPLPRS